MRTKNSEGKAQYHHIDLGEIDGVEVDYYYLLKSNTNRTNDTNIQDTLRNLGLEKIAGAMMWVLNEILGLDEKYLIAPKDEKRGKVLLAEIMKGGNFGHCDVENQKATTAVKKNILRIKRDLRMMRYYPSECLWEPVFRVYHWIWRLSAYVGRNSVSSIGQNQSLTSLLN